LCRYSMPCIVHIYKLNQTRKDSKTTATLKSDTVAEISNPIARHLTHNAPVSL